MDAFASLAVSLSPELAAAAQGIGAAAMLRAAAQAVQDSTGARDADAARQVLGRDAQIALDLRARLVAIAAARSGPKAAPDAARDRSPGQWGAPVVSVVVLATFGCVMWAAMTRVLPAGSETIVNMLLGTLAAMATSVVSYWVGSSAGSAAKTALLFRARPGPADPG